MSTDHPPKPTRRHLERPSKEQIKLLPSFDALPLQHIHLLRTPADFAFALAQLRNEPFIGFDTESKPCFTSDAPRTGPHVLQFATRDKAFIVQLNANPPLDFLREVIESQRMVKVGFGLKSDRGPLQRKLGLKLGAAVDLASGIRRLGYKQAVGVRTAVAIALGRQLRKSKSATTSNWAATHLSDNQVQYAGEDAFAALAVFYALGMGDDQPI
ncbi:3'-5' exonuclease domain-containing protein 2 [Pseudomonas sp. LS44]|uniref:3'-5' exonuclease n=1 Tax=Pseudomonas sp. LS44 TaxID=1357074 RepID=UPI00215AA59E|nr:3'-5' exonuclease [Pseudomonas sp. LS44]UVE17132.1 3'-5' exonuclease domain-containing protein 2 [Pseudomonas sp. LS44]